MTKKEKYSRKLTTMLEIAVNQRSVRYLRKLSDNDVLDIWESKAGDLEPLSIGYGEDIIDYIICLSCLKVISERHPKEVQRWTKNTSLHLRQLIEGKEVNHGR